MDCLTSNRNDYKDTTDEGKSNGIMWLSQKIVPDWKNNFMKYSRVALAIRGFYWWLPTLAPLCFVGFNPLVILGCILFLSVGFPIACEIGYRTSKLFSFNKYGFSILGDMSTSIDYMTEIVNDNEDYDMTDVILVDEDYL